MEKWLFDILQDNTLVDNQSYVAQESVLSNHRFSNNVTLIQKGRKHKHPTKVWLFLNQLHQEVNGLLANRKKEALVLFNNEEYEHNTEDHFIEVKGIDSRNFTLITGNLVGYIKKGPYALKISARFGDEFLKHIIADADGFVELANYGGSKNEAGFEWLLVYLWKIKTQKAYRLGIPKQYKNHQASLNRVRGKIDPVTFFLNKNSGTYLCNYREHSYNNQAARLIAEVFNKVKGHEFLADMHTIKNAFTIATQGLRSKPADLYRTPHFSNPYYHDYNDVIDLSKLLIRDELANFGDQTDNSAFFFDVSMLFEYYVKKLLIRAGFRLRSKFKKRLEIPTGNFTTYQRKLEPDILIENPDGLMVFDVKYKSYHFTHGVKREDLFQLHTYIGQFGNGEKIKACGFIYPIEEQKWKEKSGNQQTAVIKEHIKIMGIDIPFYVFFILVPKRADEVDYHQLFRKNSTDFLALIHEI